MAVLSLGPIVDGIRGSIGGTTFGNSIAGFTARRRPRPPEPCLASQRLNQAYLSVAASAWRNLSSALHSDWATYAATLTFTDSLGKTYHPSAIDAWIRNYVFCQSIGDVPPPTTRPTADGLPTTPVMTFDYSAHELRWTSSTPAVSATDVEKFWIFSPGSRTKFNKQLFTSAFYSSGPPSYPVTMAATIDANLSAGQLLRCHFVYRLRDVDERLSTLKSDYVDFTST